MCELSNSKREHHHVEDEEFKLAEQRQATYQSPCDIPAPGQKFDGGKVQFCLVPPLAHGIASLSFVLELNLEAATSTGVEHLADAIKANAVDADHLARAVMAAGSHA